MSKPSSSDAFPASQENLGAPQLEKESTTPRKLWQPSALSWKSTAPLCAILILAAISLEVLLHESNKNGGFVTVSVSTTSAKQFLKSFVPTVLFLPVLIWLGKAYLEMKVVQPYLDLSRGDASAHSAITSEYLTQGPSTTIRESYARRHLVLATASAIMLVTLVFQPLAGSLFTVKLAERTTTVSVTTAGQLVYNAARALGSYTPYVAAAGFLDASISTAGLLPPFIQYYETENTGYLAPPFDIAGGVPLNSDGIRTLTIPTQSLYFEVECAAAPTVNITPGPTNYTVVASLSDNCIQTLSIPNAYDNIWRGIAGIAVPECIPDITSGAGYSNLVESNYPVAFSFYANATQATTVFCYALQYEQTGTATYDFNSKYMTGLRDLKVVENSVLSGYSFNGMQTNDNSVYATGLREAVGLALGDAAVNQASQDYGLLGIGGNLTQQEADLSHPNPALLHIVKNVFRNYVMIAANGIYVSGTPTTTSGQFVTQESRLYAFAPAVHVLAVLCLLTGIILAFVFYIHTQQRRELYLSDRPTTLGVVGALLSRSHVAELLDPRDTNEDIEKKLSGLRFGIDRETGAIERTGRDQV